MSAVADSFRALDLPLLDDSPEIRRLIEVVAITSDGLG